MPEILYRKWRPRSFAELAGQEHVTTTLANALAGGRVAHAYLFAGPRGTGKTTTGRLLAKALNCQDRRNGDACNECESCQSFLSSRAMDLIEMDAASNRGIEEIRSLRDKVGFAPGAGEFKVYLIDEVHMLTEAAFNALLKTLEEPPPHVIFILATTDAHKVPATILSRCQRLDFRRAPLSASIGNLERICTGEGMTCEPAALELIARSATGSHRDAVNLLDQLATSYGNDLTVEHVRTGLGLIGDERAGQLGRFAVNGNLAGGLELIASVRDDGLDLRQFQRELVAELRAMLMVKSGLPAAQSGVTEERRRDLEASVANVSAARLLTALRAFGEADLKPDPDSTLPLDIALAECILEIPQSSNQAINPEPVAVGSRAASAPAPTARQAPPRRDFPPPPPRREAPPINLGSVSDISPPGIEAEPTIAMPPPGLEPDPSAPEPVEARVPNGAAQPAAPPLVSAAGPGAGSVEPTLIGLRASMRAVYQMAKEKSAPLGGFINSGCDIIKADGQNVVIGFKFANLAQKAGDKTNSEHLRAIFLELTGQEMNITCIQSDDIVDWKLREPSTRSSLVRAAQEMGARVISPGPEGPA